MIILPAIDIKDGNCVRLVRGDYGTAHKVAEDYMQTAKSFIEAGAEWIHMVDLDGAKDAKPVNTAIFLLSSKVISNFIMLFFQTGCLFSGPHLEPFG